MSEPFSSRISGAIARPDVPQHFMVLQPVGQRVIVKRGETVVAESGDAVWLMEAGKTLYPPVIYLPTGDLKVALVSEDKTTHCPLKGDASYFSLPGDEDAKEFAWSYEDPLAFSQPIKGLIAFYRDKVTVEIAC
ncbi:MAG: DUF427 domain-containing protein [Rhizobiaceae bacterium]